MLCLRHSWNVSLCPCPCFDAQGIMSLYCRIYIYTEILDTTYIHDESLSLLSVSCDIVHRVVVYYIILFLTYNIICYCTFTTTTFTAADGSRCWVSSSRCNNRQYLAKPSPCSVLTIYPLIFLKPKHKSSSREESYKRREKNYGLQQQKEWNVYYYYSIRSLRSREPLQHHTHAESTAKRLMWPGAFVWAITIIVRRHRKTPIRHREHTSKEAD